MDLLWIGSSDGMEQGLVERAGIAYRAIDTGQLRGISPRAALANTGKMQAGVRQSLGILREYGPDVCLVTGGYVCAPVVMACRIRRIPVMIYLPDMVPGMAIRMLSRLSQRVAVSFPDAAQWFGGAAPVGKAVVTGYPVREELVTASRDRTGSRQRLAQALERPSLDDDLPLMLVWGGSQGARSINQATWGALPVLLPHAQIVHVVGTRDWPLYLEQAAVQDPAGELAQRYHPVAYLHDEMSLALAAADLTVARAGASTLGEFPVAHLPSILVPLPQAGVNQQGNADQLVAQGAAEVVADAELPGRLAPVALALLQDQARLAAMSQAAGQLARPDAALRIGQELLRMARQ